MASSQVWLITGASSGFGTVLAKAALKAGHKVIATARNPVKAAEAHPEIESLGGRWLELDVTSPDTKEKVDKAIQEFGRIDVVINNAGYSILGSVEDMSEEEIHQQVNTNFYGPIRVIKAALPYMRSQKSGTIVNVSSIAGLDGYPSCGLYAASKFALEGLSESLSRELASFNIRVLLVEPGAFRTNFLGAFQSPAAGLTKDYEGTVLDDMLKTFHAANGKQPGDPVKAADRIIEVISGTGMGAGKTHLLRLPLGPDCMNRARAKVESLSKNLDEMEAIALSTDLEKP
ncbi:putative short chain oxidoreductase/dehydrogenase [Thermoascus aurantiacus ATCC 26904]